jgi:hypothetical protein
MAAAAKEEAAAVATEEGGSMEVVAAVEVALIPCETMSLGELAQPSRGGLSHIYNECVTMV